MVKDHSLWRGHEGGENGVDIAANPNTQAHEIITGKSAEQDLGQSSVRRETPTGLRHTDKPC